MKTAFVIFFFALTVQINCQTVESFSLISNNKITVIKFKPWDYLEFTLAKVKYNNGYSQRFIQGDIIKISDTSIVFAPTIDYLFFNCKPDSTKVIERHQKDPHYQLCIKPFEIEKISFQTRNAQNWQGIGFSGMILGGITALFVAPLISINYKNGGFNTKTYFTCAGIGLGFVTICIPISVLNKEKEFYLSQPEDDKIRSVWKIN